MMPTVRNGCTPSRPPPDRSPGPTRTIAAPAQNNTPMTPMKITPWRNASLALRRARPNIVRAEALPNQRCRRRRESGTRQERHALDRENRIVRRERDRAKSLLPCARYTIKADWKASCSAPAGNPTRSKPHATSRAEARENGRGAACRAHASE